MRVLSFNIRYDNPADGENAWRHRRHEVAQRIAALNPTVFGLQEALYSQLVSLEQDLNEAVSVEERLYQWVGVGRNDGERSGEFAPIFFQPTKVSLEAWGTFWLSKSPHVPGSSFEEAHLPRLATWARFKPREPLAALDGSLPQQFFVFNTHFDHGPDRARERSARLLLKQIQTICGLYPSIVMGDLNATPSSNAYAIITSSFLSDVRTHAEVEGRDCPVPTFTGWLSKSERPASLEVDERRDWIIIDYILVSGWRALTYSVDLASRADGNSLSDHRPIVATLAPMYYQ